MRVYPAIDISDGKCVRLLQGRAEEITVYGDPVEMAEKWINAGAEYLHVVDLNGAFGGAVHNRSVIQCICTRARLANVLVQLGGGIRSLGDIKTRLDWGAARVILGTAAVKNMDLLERATMHYPGKIVVGLDARNGKVAVNGWKDTSDISPIELGKRLAEMGVQTCVYTDISRDGMMHGPNFESTQRLAHETGLEVIASGGIGSLNDIQKLQKMGIQGAIIGKALYENKIDLKKAIDIAKSDKKQHELTR